MSRPWLRALVPFAAWAVMAAPGHTQSVTPQALAGDFAKAWNAHDRASFDRLFTDGAVWVAVAEARTEGRRAIADEFAEIHAGWAKTTTIVQNGETEVKSVRPDVAVVLFHVGFLEGGKPVPGIDRALILVAEHQPDGWRIAAGQLTKQSPPQ